MKTYNEILEDLAVWFDKRPDLKNNMAQDPSCILREVIELLDKYGREVAEYDVKIWGIKSAIENLVRESRTL